MKNLSSILCYLIGLSITIFAGQVALSQTVAPPVDPTEKPRTVSPEPKDAHKRWLNNDVPYIITDTERKVFLALKTDEERENFIDIFWGLRDPDPDTEINEFREEYYERVAYANENFASGIPGWKTDRGRIYIRWGKPDSVESRPSGGSYDRPSYEGGGSVTTYPFEIWFYRHLNDIGEGVEIEFVDRSGTGEYSIARDPDEKLAMATTPVMRERTDPGSGNYRFQREKDNPLFRAGQIANLETPPNIKFGDLNRVLTDSAVIDNNPLEFDLRVDFFRQSDDSVITAFTIQAKNDQLNFTPVGGLETATLNVFGRITSVSNKRSGIFEDSVTTNATTAELAGLKQRSAVYQKALAPAPGIYKVGVIVRDIGTGNTGIVNLGFTVPRYDDRKLSTSSLVLTSTLRQTNESDIGQRFVIGGAKVIPNLAGTYRQGQEVGVYLQVYNAGIDQTTLRPAVDVNYILTRGGKEVLRQAEDWSGLSDSGQRLTLARLLPTANVPVGDYEVRVEVKDRVGGQLIENTGKFTITK